MIVLLGASTAAAKANTGGHAGAAGGRLRGGQRHSQCRS